MLLHPAASASMQINAPEVNAADRIRISYPTFSDAFLTECIPTPYPLPPRMAARRKKVARIVQLCNRCCTIVMRLLRAAETGFPRLHQRRREERGWPWHDSVAIKRYQGEREAEFGEREGLTVALMTNTF